MKTKNCLAVFLLLMPLWLHAQEKLPAKTRQNIQSFLSVFKSTGIQNDDVLRVNSITANRSKRRVTILLNEVLGERPISVQEAVQLKRDIKKRLPAPFNTYELDILCGKLPLEQLVEPDFCDTIYNKRIWGDITYKGYPWVTNSSRPWKAPQGLQDRHLSLWASHGRYYDQNKNLWKWQRPRLFCTSEDQFTQSIVVPFLMPMLENAGAIVWTPRERDWQKHEVVVDNNNSQQNGFYQEITGRNEWVAVAPGFAWNKSIMLNQDTPFQNGTYVITDAQTNHRQASSIIWQPEIPEDGNYAVYISYAHLPTNVPDAQYTVCHSGVNTTYKVNQKMGGGTWVYLGTHHFQAGCSADNCVKLTNQSNYRGTVTADAVRFGGGMGTVARGDSIYPAVLSQMPRYLEGSRYSTQWAGAPYEIYACKEGANDYTEDINARSLMTNYLARGSVYLPGDSGLCVPLEMNLAVHSDAGLRQDSSIVGTLGIYTTGKYTKGEYEGFLAEGILPSGVNRMTSRNLINHIMRSITDDMTATTGTWTRRQMYDRNYSESRVPELPSAILESMSHQNWSDLRYGHDPWFKFLFARSIYKGILRYISSMHGQKTSVTQPLPVQNFAVLLNEQMDSVHLSWQPTVDPLDATAFPTEYLVQTADDKSDWQSGAIVKSNSLTLPILRGRLMRYRVSALNTGGKSMPSAELVAYIPQEATRRLLVVNAFNRLAGPAPIDNATCRGFNMNDDPGVVFLHSPCYTGKQIVFDKTDLPSLGQSGEEYEKILVAGNTFDYPTQHARCIARATTDVAVESCMNDALITMRNALPQVDMVDYIFGAQRNDGYSMLSKPVFTSATMDIMWHYAKMGASILCSGAYLSEELDNEEKRAFAQEVLHLQPNGSVNISEGQNMLQGMGTTFTINNDLNEETFSTTRCSSLQPMEGAFVSSLYTTSQQAASVAWSCEKQHVLTYGYPLEMITDKQLREAIIEASIKFLIQ